MREPTRENIAASRAAIEAKRRSGTRFDSAVMSRLAEALLTAAMRRPPKRRCKKPSASSSNPGSGSGLRTCIAFKARSRSSGRKQIGRGRKPVPQGDRDRPQPGRPHARIARRDRSRPATARHGVEQRSPRTVGADPRAGSRAARPRATSATPARCWQRSGEQLAALSAWATEHRFGIKRGVRPCIVSVAFGRCLWAIRSRPRRTEKAIVTGSG